MTSDLSASSPHANLYTAHPLSPNSKCIRIIDIHAPTALSPSQEPEIIYADLRVIDLESQPSFAALSYVWGAYAPEPHTISCSNCKIPVTANCYSALLHLRKRLGRFTIWIDAICIDQNSDAEKSQQIPLMNRIYSDAKAVYVWLGDGNPATDRAMRYLANAGKLEYFIKNSTSTEEEVFSPRPFAASFSVYTSRWSFTRHPYLFESSASGWRLPAFMRIKRFQNAIYATYEDLEDLLSRDWIRRLWTYQEILLANNPIVVCGNAHLPWSRFELSIIFLEDTGVNYEDIITPKIQALRSWKRVAFSRERLIALESNRQMLNSSLTNTQMPRLQQYQKFVHGIVGWRNQFLTVFYPIIGISCGITIIFSILTAIKFNDPSARTVLNKAGCISILAIFSIIVVLSFSDRLRRYLCHQPATRAPVEPTVSDDLVDGLSTRHAKDPKDMAFGVRTVLQKRSNLNLPAPDYSVSTGQVYKELSIHLIEICGSLHLLVFAALKSFPDQPSWVPDWSCSLYDFWPGLEVDITDFYEYRSERESKLAQNARTIPVPRFRFSTLNDRILIACGRHLCTISTLFEFHLAQDSCWGTVDQPNWENLQTILELHKHHTGSGNFADFLSRLFRIKWPPSLSSSRLLHWMHFLESHRDKDLANAFTILQRSDSISFLSFPSRYGAGLKILQKTTYRDIWATHVEISNTIARLSRVAFAGDHKEIGLCLRSAQIGDCVKFIPGAPLPVVLCQSNCDGLSILVSPAVFADEEFNVAKASGMGNGLEYEDIILS
ncbi:uncharacterized protein BP5553_08471 [Venustampulla echinocandica]|uniref:Heterokaryon incompatibility domain-containing protein n=1 Tax=Venustampulla echinocandica TaxID=2656787 RepID=A0A370TEB0_9HELO|nr:uncharacterized protein BP5553_08471 [Venustampulla echinocandica]RDL33032.1 hypothetical protein BP5553_08471 [Venustampulla echinocandica]